MRDVPPGPDGWRGKAFFPIRHALFANPSLLPLDQNGLLQREPRFGRQRSLQLGNQALGVWGRNLDIEIAGDEILPAADSLAEIMFGEQVVHEPGGAPASVGGRRKAQDQDRHRPHAAYRTSS